MSTPSSVVSTLLAVAAGLALSSCSSIQRRPVSPALAAAAKPGEGFIAATVVSRGMDRSGKQVPASGRVAVRARGTGSNKSVTATLLPQIADKEAGAFTNMLRVEFRPAVPSDVIAIPVPAGDYEITGWSVSDMAVSAEVTFMNRLPLKVPVQVRAGETTYVGRVNALTIYGTNILGMKVPGEALVMLTDEYEKDSQRIASFYPSIRKSSIRRSSVPKLYQQDMRRIAETPSKFFGLFN